MSCSNCLDFKAVSKGWSGYACTYLVYDKDCDYDTIVTLPHTLITTRLRIITSMNTYCVGLHSMGHYTSAGASLPNAEKDDRSGIPPVEAHQHDQQEAGHSNDTQSQKKQSRHRDSAQDRAFTEVAPPPIMPTPPPPPCMVAPPQILLTHSQVGLCADTSERSVHASGDYTKLQ